VDKSRFLTIDFKLLWEYIGYITNKKVLNMKNYTMKQIKKAWFSAYNEDIKIEYKGFITLLKKQLKQVKTK